MADKPILFSAPMVRALLDGRKTQTRRVLKPQPMMYAAGDCSINGHRGPVDYLMRDVAPKYWTGYAPSHRLWVRECWARYFDDSPPVYRANYDDLPLPPGVKWKPSIYMPRWASRLTLIVTDVRVQRVQEISADDIYAEGTPGAWDAWGKHSCLVACRQAWVDLWDGLNAKRGFGWDANPWVVALTFRVIKQNIDAVDGDDLERVLSDPGFRATGGLCL